MLRSGESHQSISLSSGFQLGSNCGSWQAPGPGRYILGFFSWAGASSWPNLLTKLSSILSLWFLSRSCHLTFLSEVWVLIALPLLNPVILHNSLWFCFANSPFVNKPSWNDRHLCVPSVSYWDGDWYRLNSCACVQREKQNKAFC